MNSFLLYAIINLTAESSIENVLVASNISTFSILSVRPDEPELKFSIMDKSLKQILLFLRVYHQIKDI